MYIEYNPNPLSRRVGDCAVRALTKALDLDWEQAYALICANGALMGDMPSADAVWGATLRQHNYFREAIPTSCPECYTAEDFCKDHPNGTYVLAFGGHVAAVHNGDLYDAWDSSNLIPQYFWYKEKK